MCGVFVSEGSFKYLLIVELQGTSRGEGRTGGPNPFWEKLCRKKRDGRAVFSTSIKAERAGDLHLNLSGR